MHPHSTNTPPAKKSKFFGGLMLFLGLAIIAVFAALLFLPKTQRDIDKAATEAAENSKSIDMHADFRADGSSLVIENQDPFDYLATEVTINDNYTYKIGKVKARGKSAIPLREFVTEEGNRYSPIASKVIKISFYAETKEGKYGQIRLTRQ